MKEVPQAADENYPEPSIEEILQAFAISKDAEYVFPPTLNSQQRFLVHEIAEKIGGIDHVSVGEGHQRHIVVSKTEKKLSEPAKVSHSTSKSPAPEPVLGCLTSNDNIVEKAVTTNTKVKSKELKLCQLCSKEVPLQNYDLHQLRCKPFSKSEDKCDTRSASQPSKEGSKPKSAKEKKRKTPKAAKPKPEEEEDFDELIADAIKENSTCHFKKCKTLVITMGQNCQYCAKRFCLSHHIPEGHGCGDKAKASGRAQISRDGVLHRGSGVPNKKPDPVKRAHLQRKLDSKLDKFAEQRHTKKKDDN